VDAIWSFFRAHPWPIAAAAGLIVLAGALVGGAYAYDASKSDVIADGVKIGFVPVGGLTPADARAKLHRVYRPLSRRLVVRAGDRRWRVSARRLGVEVEANAAVATALDRSRRGWFLTRAVRELSGGDVDAALPAPVSFSDSAVNRLVRTVQKALEQHSRNARLVAGPDSVSVVKGRDGIDVDGALLRRQIGHALVSVDAARLLPVPRQHVAPAQTVAKLERKYPSFITVDRSRFQLRVFQDLELEHTYTIAVGQIGLETPAGLYHIENKAVNPAWSVPNSAWAGSLAGQVIPGGTAQNPLKARWLGIYAGAGIHGTSDDGSIGTAASHGCIRMHIPDVIDLYDRVPVGAPVYIA
jgi:lipoprotein-anchoring transpeptidase ErfK/SrfK